jgi:hypothetical protein
LKDFETDGSLARPYRRNIISPKTQSKRPGGELQASIMPNAGSRTLQLFCSEREMGLRIGIKISAK